MVLTVTHRELETLLRRGAVTLLRNAPVRANNLAIRTRGSNTTHRAVVTRQTQVDLQQVDDEQAGQLGFGSAGELRRWWRERWQGVEPPASEQPFATPTPAHIVHLELDRTEPPRLLGRGRNIRDLGYVTSPARALPGEPEAVPAAWQDYLTDRAKQRTSALFRQQLAEQLRRVEREIDRTEQLARKNGVAWHRQARTVKRLLHLLEQTVDGEAA